MAPRIHWNGLPLRSIPNTCCSYSKAANISWRPSLALLRLSSRQTPSCKSLLRAESRYRRRETEINLPGEAPLAMVKLVSSHAPNQMMLV
jgi:hypothetical protein